jgi:hypothetical protein
MIKGFACKVRSGAAGLLFALILTGCSSISEYSHAYLSAPRVAPNAPDKVLVLTSEPTQAKDRLGEVRLSIEGEPSRDDIEKRLKRGAARLGADAVFVVYDRLHVFPVVYAGWYGPVGVSEFTRREIVAIAIKYR